MNVLRFNNRADMEAHIIQAKADSKMNGDIHLLQSSLTTGSHWVRFVDIAQRVVEFGYVPEPHERLAIETEAGATKREAAEAVQDGVQSERAGILWSLVFSAVYPDGTLEAREKSNVWPIEEALFNAAAEAQWQIDLMPVSQKINLNAAFIAQRKTRRGDR